MRVRQAFTLIELLVVIAVIAVLMAILMPALQRAREQGKRAVCLSNVKQFGLSWVLYADGHAEYWKWEDMRTVKVARQEGDWQSLVAASGNPDIQRVQRAAWGQLGYTP